MLELLHGVNAELKYVHSDPEPKQDFVVHGYGQWAASAYDLGSYSRYSKGGTVELTLKIERNDGLSPGAFDQQPARTMIPRNDLTPDGEIATFMKKVHVGMSTEALSLQTARHPQNFIRLILPSADGSWKVVEAALVAQDDRLFLTCQSFYTGQAYRATDGSVTIPNYHGWAQFREMLTKMFVGRSLPDVHEYQEEPAAAIPKVSGNHGTIKWYNLAQQWGVAYASRNEKVIEARVHWSHSGAYRGRIVFFEPGEPISFGDIVTPRSADPNRPTTFQHELHEVVSELAPPKAVSQNVFQAMRDRYAR